MTHEINYKKVQIIDSDLTFEKIYEKKYIPSEYLDEIKKANLLIVPNENFRKKGDVLFPETTREFFEYIQDHPNDEIVADIAISDDNFQRIELHSAVIEVATIIVNVVVLPVAINMISNYLYDLIKKYHRKPEDTSARLKIISEETKTKKTKIISYEGPVSEVKETLEIATKEIFSEDK
jgi:hypothetical protein